MHLQFCRTRVRLLTCLYSISRHSSWAEPVVDNLLLSQNSLLSSSAKRMSDALQAIASTNASIADTDFKNPGIFTNSLLKTTDTTQIIRDIRDEEVVFFQGKKMVDIDYELINNSGFSTSDGFAQHEFYKLLEDEISTASSLNEKFDALVPPELRDNHEYAADIDNIRSIYKRTHIIAKIWASPTGNMLDHKTNRMLENAKAQLDALLQTLREVSECQTLLKQQKRELNQSYEAKET